MTWLRLAKKFKISCIILTNTIQNLTDFFVIGWHGHFVSIHKWYVKVTSKLQKKSLFQTNIFLSWDSGTKKTNTGFSAHCIQKNSRKRGKLCSLYNDTSHVNSIRNHNKDFMLYTECGTYTKSVRSRMHET